MVSFHRWSLILSRPVEPNRGGGLLLPSKFPEPSATYFIDLGPLKG